MDEVSNPIAPVEFGTDVATILRLSLKEQCVALKVRLVEVDLPDVSPIERGAVLHFETQGYRAHRGEGAAMLMLIKACCLDVLKALNRLSVTDVIRRFTEAQFTVHRNHADTILNEIGDATRDTVRDHFNELYADPFNRHFFPDLTEEFIVELFVAIGADALVEIAGKLIEDPYAYRSGWPDITAVRGGQYSLIEVKAKDKLHESQIRWIQNISPLIDDFWVMRSHVSSTPRKHRPTPVAESPAAEPQEGRAKRETPRYAIIFKKTGLVVSISDVKAWDPMFESHPCSKALADQFNDEGECSFVLVDGRALAPSELGEAL